MTDVKIAHGTSKLLDAHVQWCYTCAECGGQFVGTAEGEAAAQAEVLKNFSRPHTDPDMVRICDDCYNKLMKRLNG